MVRLVRRRLSKDSTHDAHRLFINGLTALCAQWRSEDVGVVSLLRVIHLHSLVS